MKLQMVFNRLCLFLLAFAAAVFLASCDLSLLTETPADGSTEQTTQTTARISEKVTVTFLQNEDVLSTQEILAGTKVTLPDFPAQENEGYTFTVQGWDADGDGLPEASPYTVEEDTVFTLLYTATPKMFHYEIYVLDSLKASVTVPYGTEIAYPTVESYADAQTDEVLLFEGWEYDHVFEGKTYIYVTKNVRIDARFADTQILKLHYNGSLMADVKKPGASLDYENDFNISAPDGYTVRWYTDSSYTNKFTGTFMPEGNLSLWGKTEFKETDTTPISAASRDEILADFQQMLLNRVTERKYLLSYSETDTDGLVNYLVANAVSYSGYDLSAKQLDQNLTLTLTLPEIATKKSKNIFYTQVLSMNVPPFEQTRSQTFDSFAVNDLTLTYPVATSDALFYALEQGYKPEIDPDNFTLIALYNTMKNALRNSVSDGMTDAQKVRAIYDYLVMSVTYDVDILDKVKDQEKGLTAYNSFYLEGVFLDNLAVCDGFSKAFTCLCRMEGIECFRVTGTTVADSVAHAWNKVKLDGNWYVVDVTAAGTVSDSKEYLTYAFFLRTDAEYAAHATEDNKYNTGIVANTETNFYLCETFSIKDEVFSLYFDNEGQAAKLVKTFYDSAPEGVSSLDVRLSSNEDLETKLGNILRLAGIYESISYVPSLDSVILIFNK